MPGGKGWVKSRTETLLFVLSLFVTVVSVKSEISIHLADYRVVLGAEVEG